MATSIFVSSTSKDLKAHRRAVRDAILNLGMHPILMEHFGSQPGGAVKVSLTEVGQAEIFVGIIGHRYGYIPERDTKSVTEQEYDEAVRLKLPRLIYIVDANYDWPWEGKDAPENQEDTDTKNRLLSFKKRLEKDEVRTLFTTSEDLELQITADIPKIILRNQEQQLRGRQLNRRWLLLATTTIVVIIIIAAALSNLGTLRNWGIIPPLPSPTPLPSGFNVVVARIGQLQSNGSFAPSAASDYISDLILNSIKQLSDVDYALGRNDAGVESILGWNPTDRKAEAQQIAEQLNATIVIYGYVIQNQSDFEFRPEFYIAPSFVANVPDLVDNGTFGPGVTYSLSVTPDAQLKDRVKAIQLFLNGLVAFIGGNSSKAQTDFRSAGDLVPQSGGEVFYIFAGNAASRFANEDPGNAMSHYLDSLQLYTMSLTNRGTYARGLLGRGSALFQIAGQTYRQSPTTYDPNLQLPPETKCYESPTVPPPTRIELLIQLADICYKEANASTDKKPSEDLDVKIPFQYGLLYQWGSQNEFGDYWDWDKSETFMKQVTQLYDTATPEKQARIRVQAGIAYGTLAHQLEILHPDDAASLKEAVINFYQGIAILAQDTNVAYACKFIVAYKAEIEKITPKLSGIDIEGIPTTSIPKCA